MVTYLRTKLNNRKSYMIYQKVPFSITLNLDYFNGMSLLDVEYL